MKKTEPWTLLLVFLILCGCQSMSQRTAPEKNQTSLQRTASGGTYSIPDPLVSLNNLFVSGYSNRQATVKSNVSLMIVASFSSVILYWNGAAETNRAIPDIYHALKAIAHVPFGIFLRVDPYATDPPRALPAEILQEMKEYQERISDAESSLSNANYSADQLIRQKEVLGACKLFLATVEKDRTVTRKELLSFTRKLGPLLLANANDAAAAQLDMTHAAVMSWKQKIPVEEWKRLVVVVRGLQMTRRLNIFTQYFAKLLGEPGHNLGYPLESRRLIFAEFILRGRDHFDLMATAFIDGDASEAFFGDRWRMSRDVLADGAEGHLRQMKFD